jgi:hypothetical protein
MTNIKDQITQEFYSFCSLFEENKVQNIKKIIQTNLANKTYDAKSEQLTISLVLDSCSVILIKLYNSSDLNISLFHECIGATPLSYHSNISKNQRLLSSLFSKSGYEECIDSSQNNSKGE